MKLTVVAPAFSHFPGQWHLSPVLDTGELVFLSGVTGCRPDGTVANDPEEQFRDAFQFLSDTLGAAGLTFDDVVEMATYHVGLRKNLSAFIKVKDEFVRAPYPAWSAIGTTELITEGTLAEIRVICLRQRPSRRSAPGHERSSVR
jgi:enamine deaminase RidA (YjgF/YER057c/UK114 family)